MKDVWKQTLVILEKSLNPGLFKVWIKPLQAECDHGALNLYAPNEFVASWVKERLLDDIADAAAQTMGRKPDIQVAVSQKKTANTQNEEETACIRMDGVAKRLYLPDMAQKWPSTNVWRFSFDDFVVGSCNELAYMAAMEMAQGG